MNKKEENQSKKRGRGSKTIKAKKKSFPILAMSLHCLAVHLKNPQSESHQEHCLEIGIVQDPPQPD
jgi:hypothetical protein